MASRENQGLQAALIVFVLITIALAVTTYVYFRKAEEQGARADTAEAATQKASTDLRSALDERNRLKEYLGFDIAEQMAVIEKRYQEDMAIFGADYPDSDPKNYRTLPDYVLKAAVKRSEDYVSEQKRAAQALTEKAATETRVAGEKAALETQNQQLVATYDQERQAFNTERARITQDNQKIAGDLKNKNTQIVAAQTQVKQTEERLKSQIDQLEQTLELLRTEKREREQTNFDTAAGRITYVNHVDHTVWIDLGIADGLQRHTTFSVFDQDVHEYSPDTVKGEIEVTKLIDRHLAEARVLHDDIKNPIVHGDLIYTAAWRPGVFLHFAVAGFIDINGDGLEDKDLLRNIIAANGGVIDAELDPAGNVVGPGMSVTTRYLIMGDRPDETSTDAARTGYSALYDRAALLGVELMPLPRFLSLMGYKAGAKTVQLGGRGAAAQPQPGAQGPAGAAAPAAGAAPAGAAPAGAAPPADAGDPFRERRPPRGEAGAF